VMSGELNGGAQRRSEAWTPARSVRGSVRLLEEIAFNWRSKYVLRPAVVRWAELDPAHCSVRVRRQFRWGALRGRVGENCGATSEQQRPNTREHQAPSGTRRRSQALREPTLRNLQNLHPRFKSGRRLHFPKPFPRFPQYLRPTSTSCCSERRSSCSELPAVEFCKSLHRAELSERDPNEEEVPRTSVGSRVSCFSQVVLAE
jgi:hypothetical protein